MSSQATVYSVEALKVFQGALSLYGEDSLAALGAVSAEVRRTALWLEQNRPAYWHEQIKRRREEVSIAKAEVFRRKLQKRPDYTPPMSEQMENLRKAEANLQEAEKRLSMVRKWQPRFQHAVLEFHATVQRLKDIAATDVPNAALLLGRIIEAIEGYLQVQPPSGTGPAPDGSPARALAEMEAIATKVIAEDLERTEVAGRAKAADPVESSDRFEAVERREEPGAAEPPAGAGEPEPTQLA